MDRFDATVEKVNIFGQTRHTPVLPHGLKLESRATTARYMKIFGETHVLVQISNGVLKIINTMDFHTVRKYTNPNYIHAHLSKRLRRTPHTISMATIIHASVVHYQNYPDATQWRYAHKTALQNLGTEKARYYGSQR